MGDSLRSVGKRTAYLAKKHREFCIHAENPVGSEREDEGDRGERAASIYD